jgi:glycogen synthase
VCTGGAIAEAVSQAILLHKPPKKWQKLMRHGMAGDFSWQANAIEYEKLYPDIPMSGLKSGDNRICQNCARIQL